MLQCLEFVCVAEKNVGTYEEVYEMSVGAQSRFVRMCDFAHLCSFPHTFLEPRTRHNALLLNTLLLWHDICRYIYIGALPAETRLVQ